MSFVLSLDAEIARLEEAIRDIPEVRQLRELKRVRALYDTVRSVAALSDPVTDGTGNTIAAVPAWVTNRVLAGDGLPKSVGRKPSPERVLALKIAQEFLQGATNSVRTADLLDVIAEKGVKLGGSDEVSNLSALLSASGLFQAHGRSGWTLAPKPPVEGHDEVMAEANAADMPVNPRY